jgi:histone H3/H4
MTTDTAPWKRCSTCKTPIGFGATWYACSVSTCNRKRIGLFFCSVPCWESHVPEMRHRDAWAEQNQAPTRSEWERQPPARLAAAATPATRATELPREVLVVVSKLKAYIRARSGMNTSDNVVDALSDHLRRICDRAIQNAERDGRRTVLDRDLRGLI